MAPSSQIAHYRITSKLGEGGMGAVYRATDTKLNREVAIKVLPDSVAADPDRIARFTREAQVLAALNHPNIAAIYGIEERALVMELAPGEELRGPLPIETALDYARQIAEALEAAHEKGIVHRDLKPANIKVTPDGMVKVLDFGLAAMTQGSAPSAPSAADQAVSPTLTMRATQAGMIMGTAGYMSPEQAAGKPVDKRADIWSFGVVLWEMLCGRRLFEGETVSHTLADILRGPINLSSLPAATPAPIRELLGRCLERDLKSRLRDIGEARIAIQRWTANPVAESAPPPATRGSARVAWTIAGIAAVAAVTSVYLAWRPVPAPELVRLELNAPPGAPMLPSTQSDAPAISPDGRTVAFFAGQPGKLKLYLRPLDATGARALEGTEGGEMAFWSPDGRYVGFVVFSSQTGISVIKKIAVAGGLPQALGEVPAGVLGSWSRDGVIAVSVSVAGPMYRVSANGGPVTPATVLDGSKGETSHRWPQFLPDGRHFLFLNLAKDPANSGIFVGALDSNERTRLSSEVSGAVYASGHLLYVRNRTLVAQPFDPDTRRLSGEPAPVFENINFSPPIRRGSFSASENGNLVAVAQRSRPKAQLTWLDRAGKETGRVGEPGDLSFPRLSPDGRKVAVQRESGAEGVLSVVDLDRGVFSDVKARVQGPSPGVAGGVFSPDSSRIAYAPGLSTEGVHVMAANGAGDTKLVDQGWRVSDWSRDGRYLAYSGGERGADLMIKPMDGGPPIQFVQGARGGVFSPDGKWIAYVVGNLVYSRVYVEPFSGVPSKGAGKIQVSPDGGASPMWSRDGKELYYLSKGRLMATPVRMTPGLSVGIPKALFEVPAGYDVAADGRFLVNLPVGRVEDPSMAVLLNWPVALKR